MGKWSFTVVQGQPSYNKNFTNRRLTPCFGNPSLAQCYHLIALICLRVTDGRTDRHIRRL